MPLQSIFGEKTINELLLIFGNRQMNLEPGFQRHSVWSDLDRRRLIQSILANYPVPSIFLYQRTHNGRIVYDVIDGKQRLETILMFVGKGRFKRKMFDVKLELDGEPQWHDWSQLKKNYHARGQFETYKIQIVEVTGEISEIIDLFVRINSTGKRLTSGEKRHAKYFDSRFLKEAERLVSKFQRLILHQKILSQSQIDRMKGTELFAELLMSLQHGGPINKKTSLDRAIGNDSVNGNTLHKLSHEFVATMNLLKRMFPDLRQTRFHNSVEFYSLFLLAWEFSRDGFILHEKSRNRVAFALLKKLSNGVDLLREQLKKGTIPKAAPALYRDYLLTVQGDTDSAANRERRRTILKGLLSSLFERKDRKRIFSAEQRRIIWNSDDHHRCAKCRKALTWDDFTVDHIVAYFKGGKTVLPNAQLMCRVCNSRKGGR
jgi:hypothetical protein